jgi:hypothetical protein
MGRGLSAVFRGRGKKTQILAPLPLTTECKWLICRRPRLIFRSGQPQTEFTNRKTIIRKEKGDEV